MIRMTFGTLTLAPTTPAPTTPAPRSEISIISVVFGILTLALLVYCLVCMLTNKKYEKRLEHVSEKDFPMKRFMPIGLSTLRTLMRVTHKKQLAFGNEEVRRKLMILYGEGNLKFYSTVYSADLLTYAVLLTMIGCLMAAATGMAEMFLLALLLTVVIVVMMLPKRLDDNIRDRQQAIRMEFPDFLSKYILLRSAGMTGSEAWNTASQVENPDTPFYREVTKVNHEINELHRPEEDALRGFSVRMRDSDITRFVSTVVQNIQNGGDITEALTEQSSEAWRNRKQEALKLGETAGTKLTGTMLLMFFAVLILVLAPALMNMQL